MDLISQYLASPEFAEACRQVERIAWHRLQDQF